LGTILMQAQMERRRVDVAGGTRDTFDRIERATRRMDRLIQDLLDITRVEAGQLALERTVLTARAVAAEAVEAQKTLAAKASVGLQLEAAHGLPEIFADRHRLLQVFENLIGNALKFTPEEGRVTVGAVDHAGAVLYYVRDTGPGIPAEDQVHV